MVDEDRPPSAEELAGAEELRRALEGERTPSEEAKVAGLISASAGRAVPLGDIAARRIVRAARAEADRKRRRATGPGRWAAGGLALAAAAAIALFLVLPSTVPAHLRSRPSDPLVPGPFPPGQTAAQRLDLVVTDRMIALRDASLYGARR